MKPGLVLIVRFLPLLAALLCVATVAVAGALLEGYSHRFHPVALAGAQGLPRAAPFNAVALLLPGLLAALAAGGLRAHLPAGAGWALRIGTQLLLVAALFFAAMGLLPMDARDLESTASRLHGTAWGLWCLSFTIAGLLLALGGWRTHRARARWTLAAVAGFLLATLVLPGWLDPGTSQRLAWLLWWAWWVMYVTSVMRAGEPDT